MKLQINFDSLHDSVQRMGAENREFILGVELSTIDPIDSELETGIIIGPDDIEYTKNGLLTYKGRQVLLYIQDHGSNIDTALRNGADGKKYHVAYCSTLEKMHQSGRFERYVVKNDISGNFFITGYDWQTKKHKEGTTRLNVCKNCLRHLNYKGYQNRLKQAAVFNNFSLDEFFTTYQAYFKHKPKRKAGEQKDGAYSGTWKEKSRKYRESVFWTCESCGIDLNNNKNLLHSHHKNGVKSDNSKSNLQALCIECHAEQPNHNMRVTLSQKQILRKLRTEQNAN